MRSVLCIFLGGVGFFVGSMLAKSYLDARQVQGQRQVQVQSSGAGGRVVVRERDKIPRFERPITAVPRVRPAIERQGFSWHWHPSYGWVSLAVTTAPQEVLLPPTYALPAQVEVYQAQSVQCQSVCPHCGHSLSVTFQ